MRVGVGLLFLLQFGLENEVFHCDHNHFREFELEGRLWHEVRVKFRVRVRLRLRVGTLN